MFKNLLLSIIFALSFLPAISMEPTASAIVYEGPQLTCDMQEIEIKALNGFETLGWIVYKYLPEQKAEITLFEVDQGMRNNTEHRIGQHLFQQCINDAIAHNCTHVIWTANPTSDLDLMSLCTIYEKLVKKLENSESYQLTKSEIYGKHNKKIDMTLSLKHKS